jgi:hypothetical protein
MFGTQWNGQLLFDMNSPLMQVINIYNLERVIGCRVEAWLEPIANAIDEGNKFVDLPLFHRRDADLPLDEHNRTLALFANATGISGPLVEKWYPESFRIIIMRPSFTPLDNHAFEISHFQSDPIDYHQELDSDPDLVRKVQFRRGSTPIEISASVVMHRRRKRSREIPISSIGPDLFHDGFPAVNLQDQGPVQKRRRILVMEEDFSDNPELDEMNRSIKTFHPTRATSEKQFNYCARMRTPKSGKSKCLTTSFETKRELFVFILNTLANNRLGRWRDCVLLKKAGEL